MAWSQPKGPSLKDLIRAGEVTLEQALAEAKNASESTKRKWRKAAAQFPKQDAK